MDEYLMVIIVFPNGAEWFKANWAFRQLAEDVARVHPLDADVNKEMDKSLALGALFLDRMDRPLRSRVTESLRAVAQDTLDGKIEGWSKAEDEPGHQMYLESLTELLSLLKQQQTV